MGKFAAMSHETVNERFHRDGFTVLENFMPESKLLEVETELNTLTTLHRDRIDPEDLFYEDDGKTIRQIEWLNKCGEFFAGLSQHRRFSDLIGVIFGEPSEHDNLSYMAKPARGGAAAPSHQDNAYYHLVPAHALTFWIALDESNEGNGCVRVVPGSHKMGILPHMPSGVNGLSLTLVDPPAPATEEPILLKRGDCSIHHCNTIHRSTTNTSECSRRGLLLFARTTRCIVDQQVKDRYESVRRAMITKRDGGN